MSLEFTARLANFAVDELVSTRKELKNVEDRHEKLYNDHESLKDAMIEMEKKLRTMERLVASQDEELIRLREWSTEHILRELENEWSNAASDIAKIKKLDAKYEVARQIEELKNGFEMERL
jgi:hypothetical protein